MDNYKFFLTLGGLIVPVIVAIIGASWYSQEKRRKKIEKYENLIEYFSSLYKLSKDSNNQSDPRGNFLKEYRLSFMYCPDIVIEKINCLLDCLGTKGKCSDEEKEKLAGEIIIEIRKDVYDTQVWSGYKKTKLTWKDFKHVGPQYPEQQRIGSDLEKDNL